MKKQPLPANDPRRPEWGLFADCLRKPVETPPEGRLAAERRLEELVLECMETTESCEALVNMCAGSLIRATAKSTGTYDRKDIRRFVISRLWNRRADGQQPERIDGKRGLGTSAVLRKWRSRKMGVVQYLHFAAKGILARDWRVELAGGKGGIPARFARVDVDAQDIAPGLLASAPSVGAAPPPPHREADDDERSEVEQMVTSGMEQDAPSWGALPRDTDSEIDEQEARQAEREALSAAGRAQRQQRPITLFDQRVLASAEADPLFLRSGMSPDFGLLGDALGTGPAEPAPSLEERAEQLQFMAQEVVAVYFSGPRRGAIERALSEWNPLERSFAQTFPEETLELAEMVFDEFEVARDLGQENSEPQDTQTEMLLDQIEVGRNLQALSGKAEGLSPDSRRLLGEVDGWTRAECLNPDELRSPSRPDYLALCALSNEEPRTEMDPKLLARELKRLYKGWAKSALRQWETLAPDTTSAINASLAAVDKWQPLTDGFLGEYLATARPMEQSVRNPGEKFDERRELRREMHAAMVGGGKPRNPVKPLPEPVQSAFDFGELS